MSGFFCTFEWAENKFLNVMLSLYFTCFQLVFYVEGHVLHLAYCENPETLYKLQPQMNH